MYLRVNLCVLMFVLLLFADQKVDLSGKVVDLGGNGVENVTVGLTKGNLTTKTSQNGTFQLKGVITAINPVAAMLKERIRLQGNHCVFSVKEGIEPVTIALFSTQGKKIVTVANRGFTKGTHTVQLIPKNTKLASALYLLSIQKGIHRFEIGTVIFNNRLMNTNVTVYAQQSAAHRVARAAEVVDTLYAEMQGVETALVPTETYIDSNIVLGLRLTPQFYTDKAKGTPDYSQMDNAYGGLAGNGSFYCGPCSVSNGIMWLDDNGYPNLVTNTSDRKKDQHDMIIVMGSRKYMNTENVGMAPSRDVVRGVEDYIKDKGYSCTIEFQGIYFPPPDKYIDSNRVVIDWIKEKVLGNTAVFLHVSWVRYDQSTDTYTARGGHWNTVTGYGKKSNGSIDPRYILNHDPAKPSGKTEYTRPTKFTSGTYKRGSKSWDLSTGFYKYKGGVLDGIVAVTMKDE